MSLAAAFSPPTVLKVWHCQLVKFSLFWAAVAFFWLFSDVLYCSIMGTSLACMRHLLCFLSLQVNDLRWRKFAWQTSCTFCKPTTISKH